MNINIKRLGDGFAMLAQNEDGNTINMDGSPDIGGTGTGMRPMQLLLTALGGCSTIDVLLILKKQRQKIDSLEVDIDGERENMGDYSLFRDIILHFKIVGDTTFEKVDRAVALSLEKYCSVDKTLAPTAKIGYRITLNDKTSA
jgi:putative redox protein